MAYFFVYECEAWFLPLGLEHSLNVFENRVLRKIFRFARQEDGGSYIMRSLIKHFTKLG
jgi:hypothetical protein